MRKHNERLRRLWYWRVMHCWSIIRLRQRVIFEAALIGALAASLITSNLRPVYSSRAIVHVKGMDANGVITNGEVQWWNSQPPQPNDY